MKMNAPPQTNRRQAKPKTKAQALTLEALLPIQQTQTKGANNALIDARQLHAFLMNKRRFSDWIKQRIAQYDFREGRDYFTDHKIVKRKKGQGASRATEYRLTLNTAKELAIVENNEQGRQARLYFIRCEEALKAIAPDTQAQIAKLWQESRQEAKKHYRTLDGALKRNLERQGKQAEQWHYIREAQMINAILLDSDPEKWKRERGIAGKMKLREHLTAEQLERLTYLERADEILLDSGEDDFRRRQRKLEQMHDDRFPHIAQAKQARQAYVLGKIAELMQRLSGDTTRN